MRILTHVRNLLASFFYRRKEKDPHEEHWGIGSQ